jgi:repressor LexA
VTVNIWNTGQVVPLLTVQRRRVLDAIRAFYAEQGYAPTVRELADGVGISVSAVHHQLEQLQRMGWIRRHPNRSRALVVLDPTTGRP